MVVVKNNKIVHPFFKVLLSCKGLIDSKMYILGDRKYIKSLHKQTHVY